MFVCEIASEFSPMALAVTSSAAISGPISYASSEPKGPYSLSLLFLIKFMFHFVESHQFPPKKINCFLLFMFEIEADGCIVIVVLLCPAPKIGSFRPMEGLNVSLAAVNFPRRQCAVKPLNAEPKRNDSIVPLAATIAAPGGFALHGISSFYFLFLENKL